MIWVILSGIVGVVGGYLYGHYRGSRRGETMHLLDESEASDELRNAGHVAIGERMAKRKARILDEARKTGRITNDGVEELFCISDRTASNYLKQLAEEGNLVRQGTGRGTYYEPTS